MVLRVAQAAILLSNVEPCRDKRMGVLLCRTRWTSAFLVFVLKGGNKRGSAKSSKACCAKRYRRIAQWESIPLTQGLSGGSIPPPPTMILSFTLVSVHDSNRPHQETKSRAV